MNGMIELIRDTIAWLFSMQVSFSSDIFNHSRLQLLLFNTFADY